MKLKQFIFALVAMLSSFAFTANAQVAKVAKVGNTEYTTIDDAIAAWTNNTTLTLLGDVTLSDVVTLKSTEHHILNLGTYTMTAASGKHAIEITCEGRSSASYALTVNADATNPGGITATGKSCIYYKKNGTTKDRPIILINNGVFTGSYSLNLTSNGNTNCPQIWINGGVFNSYMNLTKCMLKVSGGTFHAAINCTGDSSAYREIKGGRFKSWQFMTADAPNKFWVGSGNGNYDVGVYVDDEGYLCVGGPVITELSPKYKAKAKSNTKWSSYLKYSSAATYGLYYTSVEKAGTGATVYEHVEVVKELDNNAAVKDFTPELPSEVVTFEVEAIDIEATAEATTKVTFNVEPKNASGQKVSNPNSPITFRLPVPAAWAGKQVYVSHDGIRLDGKYTVQFGNYVVVESASFSEFAVEPVPPVAKIGNVEYATLAAAVAAVVDGGTITLIANETFTENNRYNNGGWWDGLGYSGDKSFTIDLNNFTISQDGALNDYLMWFKNDGANDNTITLKNGTLDAGTTAYCALATASSNAKKITVNLENIKVINNNSSGATLKIRAGAVLNVKADTEITGKNSYLGIECWNATVNIYDGAKIYQNGTSSYCGCLAGASGNGTINVYGGEGQSKSGGFIAMTSGGTINISGGEWIANTDGTYANGNKSVLVAQSENRAKSIVNVTGGTFKGGYNCYGAAAGDAQINISGGNFNANPASYVAEGYIVSDAEGIYNVNKAAAKVGNVYYASLNEAFTAAAEGATITLLDNASPALTSQRAITKAAVIDLGSKELTLTEDDLYFGTTTFKNGTIVVDPSVKPSTAVFWMFANQTLTFDNVKIVATGVTGTYLIGLDGNNSDLNLLNGSEILVENTTALDLDIICVNASTGNDIKVENSKVNVTNLDGRVFFRGNYTVKDSEVNLAGITKAGFRIEAGQTLSIEGTSEVNIEGEPRDGGIHLTDLTATYTKAETATVNATLSEVTPAAVIGAQKFATLQAAIDAAILMTGDVTIEIMSGTYAQDINLTNAAVTAGDANARPNITFKPAADADVTFAGTTTLGYRQQNVGASMWNGKVTFNGITFDHAENGKHSLDIQDVKGIALVNCKVIGDGEYGIGSNGGNATTDAVFTSCTFENGSMQVLGQLGANLDVDNSICNDFSFNVQGGAAPGMTIKNTTFNMTLTDAHVGESFYVVRTNASPIKIEAIKLNVDSEVSAVAADQAKWGIFWARKDADAQWNIAGCEVNLTEAAMAQTELLLTKNDATTYEKAKDRIIVTNLTSTSNSVADLIARTEGCATVNNVKYLDGELDLTGLVAKVGDAYYATLAEAITAAQAGNEVVILKAGTYALKVKDGITITGAVAGVEFANIGAFGCNGANVTFNNVTFTYAANSTYMGLQHSGNLVYNNCTFNGQVFLYGASETFNKCTFVNTGDNYNVWTYGAANVAFNECTFNCDGKSVLVYTEGANTYNNVSVTKCQFNAAQAVVGKAAIEMDSSLSAGINLTIDGETTATGFDNGNVSGNSLWNNKKGNSTDANNDITVKVGDTTVLAPIFEAQIGDAQYRNLQAAINAVQNGETITLTADVEYSNVASATDNTTSVNVPAGKKFTLDLNGYTISGENNTNGSFAFMTICSGADVTINDTSAGKTGKIVYTSTRDTANENHEGYTIRNKGNLTLNGGTIENATPLASNGAEKCVTTAVDNCNSSGAASTFTMNGGVVVSQTYFAIRSNVYANNTIADGAAHVAINGGTVYGLHFCDWGSKNLNYQVAIGADAVVEHGNYPDLTDQALRLAIGTAATSKVAIDIAEDATINGAIYGAAAKVGTKYYSKLQKAIEAVQNGETITLIADNKENVVINEKDNVKVTIDGAGKKMTGTIKVVALSSDNDRRITIKNINFVDATSAKVDFITSVETNHYPRITVEGCTFTGSGDATDVALRLKSSHSVVIKNCTGKGLHSFLQNTSGWNLTIDGVTVTDSKSAFALGTVQGVTVKGVNVDVTGYGIRLDAGYNNNAVIESNAIKAFIPVVVRNASVDSNIAVNGTNTMTATNDDDIWMAVGTSEYETNGTMPTAATGKVVVALNDAALDSKGIYGNALAGQGTAEAPYLINNIGELVLFRNSVNAGETKYNAPGVWVALAADIDMTGENWVGIGSATADHGFMGNFDGQRYKIMNLTITDPALDSEGYAYAGLFGVTEGTDKNNQNTIKNLIIENVTINTTGQIVAAAIAYPYYTIVDNVKVCGDIKINGGNYTAGVLAYTRRCVNASNLAVAGNDGSYITGAQVVGGVISDIQMNGGLVADYKNFSAQGVTVSGTKNVGGISGIIATQSLNGATVKDVTLNCSDARVGIVAGCLGGTSTISNVTYDNVAGATALLGATYEGNAIEAKIGETYYATLDAALATQGAATVELLVPVTVATGESRVIDLNGKTITGTDNAIGSFALININPEAELTINGEGAIKLTATNNRGWNAYSSVISNQRGKLTVNGGTIEHLGGTDMAYAIDILTNTGAQNAEATISGGTVKSTYRAIRQFLNSTSAQNVLTVNGGTIEGANKSIWMQGANANANPGALTVAAAAAIKGNVYLTTAEGTAEYPVVVAVAADALKDGAQVLTSNVPATYALNNVNGVWGNVAAAAAINGKGYATLAAAVAAAQNGATVELLADVTLAGGYADTTEGLRIEKEITLNGNDHTIDCGNFQKGIRVYNPTKESDFNVNFNNVKVVNNVANGRCIDTRSGNINLKVNSSTLIATNGNSQPLTIGGNDPVHRVTLDGTTIDAGTSGYAVISFVSTNVDINGANNSTISGFAAFYLKGDAKTTNLNLGQGIYTGTNNHPAESGLFGTIVLEGDNNVVNLMGTNATVKAVANNTASQAAFLVRGANNTIKVTKESAKIITEGNAYEAIVDAENAATTKFIDMNVERKLVAENRGYQFYSFEEAVRFAGNEGTIKIVNDFELADTWTIPAGKTVTLDLNGKTISQSKACTASYEMINNKGNLTITGNGKISFTDTSAGDPTFGWGSYTVRNEGNLVVENGTIKHLGEQAFGKHCIMAIYQYCGSTTINGGTISTPNYRSARLWKGDMTINGGNFEGQLWVQAVDNTAKLTVNGGTFEPNGNDASAVFVTNNQYDVQLAVTGGTFNGKVGCSDAAKLANAITGGKFNAAAVAGTNVDLIAFGYEFGAADADGYQTVYNDESVLYIETLADLKAFRNSVNAGETKYNAPGVTVYLAADIDLNNEEWEPIGTFDYSFDGNFDGKGHVIKNLKITDNTAANGEAYLAFFGVTANNTIKDFVIENVTIESAGQIVAAAIAYPYYTTVSDITVCGNIAIKGGNYTAGVLAYTRLCQNASNLTVAGNEGSYITGAVTVGGVIADIQTNKGLVVNYSDFNVSGVTISGAKSVGAISGIISGQNLDKATVNNVTLVSQDGFAGIVAGRLGTASTVTNVSYENVTGAATLIGGGYDSAKAVQAKIGDTYYATLDAALATEGAATVELLAPVTIAKDETVVLDLNGKTVTYESAVAGEDMITNRGNLTITDSSDAKTGKLAYVNTDATASNVTVSTISTEAGSTLVVDGGTIENKTVKADGSSIYSYAIDILTNGNLGDVNVTINGGTVYSDYMAIRQFNNGTACKNSLTINGGYIYGAKRAVQVHMDNNAAVTAINGGKVEAGAEGYALCNFAKTGNFSVTGGEFIGTVYSARENFISGGIYDAEVYAGYCAEGYMPNKNVNGTYGVVLVANAYASIDGVTYGSLKAAIDAAKAGDTITLLQDVKENVTISKHLNIEGAGKTITGMITTDGKSLKVTIKNVNFDGNNKTINYAMRADDDLNLVVENCSASNYIYGLLYANKSNDKIVVKNVTVEGCAEYGAYLVSFNNATFENFTVKGDTKYGIAVANAGARTVNLKNVTFENAETPLSINEIGTGKVTFNFSGINDMSKAEFYTSQYVNVVAAAQVGTKVCGSLQDAVVAANDGETVKVLADVNMTTANFVTQVDGYATLVNVAGKAVTIDLNGKKVTVNAADADLNGKAQNNMLMSVFHADPNGTLTLTDSSAEGTGTVELIANDAKVYGLIVSENARDKSHPGKIIINGGNYIADKLSDSMIFADINEVITVNGGNFKLGNVGTGNNGSPWIFNAAGQNQIHINVNGGTYNANVGKQHYAYEVKLGEGLATTNNGDGTWTVVPGVATVGEELFGSIQEAIDAAQDGETVKLFADVTYDDADVILYENIKVMNYVAGKNIILDMNGKTIDVTYNGGKHLLGVILVEDGAGLTVVGNGKINATGTVGNGNKEQNIAYMFYKRGTTGYLTIENGTFHMNDAADSMVYTNGDEIVTINGGTFILDAVASQTNGFPVIFSTEGNNERQIVVNGGTFNYDINHQIRPFEPYVAPNKAVKKVDDMWTIVPAQAYVTEMLGDWVNEAGSREHKVGYATVAEAIAATNNLGKTVTILAGDYNGNLNVNKGVTVQGEVDAEGNNLVTFNGKLNITADGATVKNINVNNGGNSAGYINAKNVVVDGCQVVGGNGFRSCYTSGTVTFKNSVITGATYGIHFDGSANGNIVIKNCTITGWTSFAAAIDNVAISGTTFANGNYNQLRLYQNATITDCTFNENMSVDFGNNGNVVAFENCTVENGKALTDVIYIADIAEGNEVTIDGEPIIVAAKIDSKYYLSLQAAIDAATEGQTVTIVSDLALTEGVTVAADKNIFIALNGKTITGTPTEAKAYAVITNKGILTIQGEGAVICDHKLAGSTSYAVNTIVNSGVLTIDGATIENKSTAQLQIGYAIDNNSTTADAEVTVKGGKVTASGSNYYDGIRQFCNSETKENSVVVEGGEVSTIWMQNPSDGATKNTKDVKGYVAISGGTVGVLSLEPSANFEAAVTDDGHIGEVSYFQTDETAEGRNRNLKEFVKGGTFGTRIDEDPFLAYGYQVTNDAAPYKVEWTGRREVVTIVDDGKVTEFANEEDITVGTLTYKRNFGTTKNQSFYVPFEVPMSKIKDDFNVYYISNMHAYDKNEDAVADSLVLEAFKVPGNAVLKANYPYIIRAKVANTEMNIEFSEATLHEAEENSIECSSVFMKFEIQGIYSRRVGPEYEGTYLLSGGTWKTMQADTNLNAFRLGMTITETDDSPYTIPADALRSIGIRIAGEQLEDGTTVIYHVEAENNSEDVIFDLSGRRVLKAEKGGIYIINGKKVLVK